MSAFKYVAKAIVCTVLISHSFGQAPTNSSEANKEDRFAKQRRVVEEIDVRVDGKPLNLLEGPLYTYEEVIQNWHDGTSWVWGTGEGRPMAFLNMMTLGRTRYYEMISLKDGKTIATADNGLNWKPKSKWKLKEIEGAKKPASSRRLRLVQMRAIARSFKGTQFQNGEQPLRMLPQPIYRYEKESDESLDGAIFAFLRETDLETILVIEAAKQKDGPAVWKFDCSRVSISPQQVEYKDRVAWSVPRISYPQAQDGKAPYHIFLRPAMESETKQP